MRRGAVYPEQCPEPVEVTIDGCEDTVEFDAGEIGMESLGRIVLLDVTLRDVCPRKRVALAVILSEVDPAGMEHRRGLKAMTIPAHTRETCQDVTVRAIKSSFRRIWTFPVRPLQSATGAPAGPDSSHTISITDSSAKGSDRRACRFFGTRAGALWRPLTCQTKRTAATLIRFLSSRPLLTASDVKSSSGHRAFAISNGGCGALRRSRRSAA